MSWQLSMIRQLVRLATRPDPRSGKARPVAARTAGDRCGCCPSCRAFVRVDPPEGEEVECPACGQPIDTLDPLGAEPG
ncbi:hypothetical protein P12x_000063 [Tundrisphaera lichenicola]|uniref:hypothetical protein n=1 Tax=Tundrisphaera lichenicola TaxID=2029860 RepID=UPI003EB866C7